MSSSCKTVKKTYEPFVWFVHDLNCRIALLLLMNLKCDSAERNIYFLELDLILTYRVLPVISWFLKNFAHPYLGASNFGFPPVL